MKYLRDGFLYEHLPKATKLMNDEIERNISTDDFPEELDQKIRLLVEPKTKNYFHVPKAAVVVFCIMSVAFFTVAVDAATGGKIYTVIKEFFGAAEVTDENRYMIGTEVINDTPLEIHYEKNWKKEISYAPEVPIPTSITGFAVKEGKTPEIILFNAACVLFYQDEYNGWNCKKGDTLLFEFEKHSTASGKSQMILIGYVLNGVMHQGELFDEINGCYQLNIEKDGEYYIYVISTASDSVTLKEGMIY